MGTVRRSRQFWGLIIYERVGDGCFNGLWNNNESPTRGRVLNEIIRKADGNTNEVVGEYISCWIEANNDPVNSQLIIERINNTEYSFVWRRGQNILFRGIGVEIGLSNIAVAYWEGGQQSLTLDTIIP